MQKDTQCRVMCKTLKSGSDFNEKIPPSTKDLVSTLNETIFCADKAVHRVFLSQLILVLLNCS